MENKLILIPQESGIKQYGKNKGRVSYEMVLAKQDGYPMFLFHVDLLYGIYKHKSLHDKLCAGETIEVEFNFSEVE